MGILGALLALPVAATVMMLINELRVELPGEREQPVDTLVREADDRGEKEYERRTEGVGAEQAAAIAEEISRDRREDEKHPPEAVGTAIESGNANGSAIGIGGSHIGLNGVDEQFSIRIIRTAVDHGINFKENLNAIHYCR